MKKTTLLFLVIFIEGYVVLASELLAIRLLIPFVGSGTEIISIIISAVLLPLAIGYHKGGNAFKRQFAGSGRSVRRILHRNILTALMILTLSLSYIFLQLFFETLTSIGIHNRLAQTAIYCAIFLVTPVFILGQTVPLISNYFSRRKLSEITGKMLFFSTTGSFFGSVFSTIILMTYAGVHNTVMITLLLLAILSILLSRRFFSFETMLAGLIVFVLFAMNNGAALRDINIVADNAYNTVQIAVADNNPSKKIMVLNRSPSSQVSNDPNDRFPYIAYIEDNYLAPLNTSDSTPREILVLGAGGFTLGQYDMVNHYTFVDIDSALKDVAEANFLPKELAQNKQFVASSARAFVHGSDKKYDMIVIDTYTNVYSIPMETTTREFLLDTKKLLKDNGILVANIISSPTFSDVFTVRYNNTFASVFPAYSRQIIGAFDPWKHMQSHEPSIANVIYSYYNTPFINDRVTYTDDKNSYSLDRLDH